ncbi:MAG: sigma-70 family RNA polymerase sigma factor [Erysipelotrichia bacterium]|nr:sigma-70 family RNA polymerase sigma factor [Erysipelotrichia bacterium]
MPKKLPRNRLTDEYLHTLCAQGNHDAYMLLANRYQRYSRKIINQILEEYPGSGISFHELMAVNNDRFPYIVQKFNPELNYFYAFWRKVISRSIMDYVMQNSYNARARTFKGTFILDDENDERIAICRYLHEEDESYLIQWQIREIAELVETNAQLFEYKERLVLQCIFQGLTLSEIAKSGLIKRSTLYLTYNKVIEKLKKLLKINEQIF